MLDEDSDVDVNYSRRRHRRINHNSDRDFRRNTSMSSMSMTTYRDKVQDYIEKVEQYDGFDNYPGVDRVEFDFVNERNNMYTTNLVESTAHLIKGCLGAGILAMPEAYMNGGLWTSFGLSFFFGLLTLYTMLTFGKSAQKMYTRVRVSKLTYSDLVEVTIATAPIECLRNWSKPMRYILDAIIFFQLCASCSIYQIMMAKTFKQALEFSSEVVQKSQVHLRFYVLLMAVPLLLLCSIRNIKYLAPLSLVGDIILVVCVAVALYFNMLEAENINKRPAWKSIKGMYHFLGVFLYSIDGFCVSMSIENHMTKPLYFPCVVWFGMCTVLASVTAVGFLGYYGCKETCKSPFTLNMPSGVFPILLQFLLAITLAFTFAVHFWIPFRIAWRYISRRIYKKRGIWERLFRCAHVILVTCVSLVIPNMYSFITFMGNVILSFVIFILPPLIESLIIWNERQRWNRKIKLICNSFITLLGFCVLGGGLAFFEFPLNEMK